MPDTHHITDAMPPDEMPRGCCAAMPRRSVADYLDRSLRRNRAGLRGFEGAPRADANGLTARFGVEIADGRIRSLSFKVSTCATLLAYCELLVELATGEDIGCAAELAPHDLVAGLPEVPLFKRDRAALAISAFHAVLAAADPRICRASTGEAS